LISNGGIVEVCDNDLDGMLAAGPIARQLKGYDFSIIRFNKTFPRSFDLANEVPKFDGRYPDIHDFIRSAIWATEVVDDEGEAETDGDEKAKKKKKKEGRPAYRLRRQFVQQWAYVVKPGVFVSRHKRRETFDVDEFNSYIRPFSDVEDTSLAKQRFEMQADGLCYKPGKDAFDIHEDKRRLINTWLPGPVQPTGGAVNRPPPIRPADWSARKEARKPKNKLKIGG
jgi:hypothetical protein